MEFPLLVEEFICWGRAPSALSLGRNVQGVSLKGLIGQVAWSTGPYGLPCVRPHVKNGIPKPLFTAQEKREAGFPVGRELFSG